MAKAKKETVVWSKKVLHFRQKKARSEHRRKKHDVALGQARRDENSEAQEHEKAVEAVAVNEVTSRTERIVVPAAKATSEWGFRETADNLLKVRRVLRDRKSVKGAGGKMPSAPSSMVSKAARDGKTAASATAEAERKLGYILNKRRAAAAKMRRAERTASGAGHTAAVAVKKGAHMISEGLKAAYAATKALIAAVVSLGSGFLIIIVIAAAIFTFAASGFGLFLNDDSGGMTVQAAITQLNQQYIAKIHQVEADNQPFDSMAIYGSKPQWKDVLTIYAAQTVSGDNPIDVTTIDDERFQKLSDVFWSMTGISTERISTTQMVKEETDVLDDDGNPTGEKEIVYKPVTTTRLKINITAKTAQDMMDTLSSDGKEQAQELLREENASLWTELLGGFGGSSGALDGDPAVVAQYLLGQGFTPEATAAVLGNIKAECNWNYSTIGVLDGLFHPYERNVGIFQFTTLTPNPNSNDEYWRFMRWCRENGFYYGSLQAQLDWAFSAAPGTSHWTTRWVNRGRYYSNAPGFSEELYAKRNLTPDSFAVETDVAAATYSWMAFYEGCTNGTGSHLDRRIAYAYEYYEQLMTQSPAGLIWPSDSNRITSYFGPRESPGGIGSTYHRGVDIGAAEGAPIQAAAGGTVVVASYSASAGNWVKIDHGNGLQTVYMHCSELYVQRGQTVNQGDVIAAVGSTGNSTGPHLHFGVMVNGDYKNPLDFVSPPA